MTINKLISGFCVSILTVIATTSLASAQVVLKLAHVYEVSTPFHEAAVKAAARFEEETDGRYKINVYPASQLGKEFALNESLAIGTVDIIYTGVGFLGQTYGPISISDYPFVLRSFDHWKAYAKSDLFAEMAAEYKKITGITVASLVYYGARHVTANKPILTPSDMKGLKIRTPNAPAFQMFPKATGANPTPLAFSEVYLALQQGLVDAQENPLPTIKFKKFYEVQSNINLTGHIINSLVLLISPVTLQKMDEDDANLLIQLLKDAGEEASGQIVQAEVDLVSWFREQGIRVNDVNRQPFMNAVMPYLKGKDVPWPPETLERLQAINE